MADRPAPAGPHRQGHLAGISVRLVDERGTSSTCPACRRRVPKPHGRTLSCAHCAFSGHRDLVAAASIATRVPGGGSAR
ncbi:zinc ribbon domain-containing protein [Micromonospora coerulea]|uniref:zinc ribbon domain-containing protein n=1 Tax=Micromonospora coerulea TaxID=47856 RepID=UPI003D1547E5